jgi:hypothetical protein
MTEESESSRPSHVPSYKIQTGAFGKPELQRDRRVEVLVSSR